MSSSGSKLKDGFMRPPESERFESFTGNNSMSVYTVNQRLKTVREEGGKIRLLVKDSNRGKCMIYIMLYIYYLESLSFTPTPHISVILSIISKNIFARVRPPGMIYSLLLMAGSESQCCLFQWQVVNPNVN